MPNILSIILGGGKGERLYPLTKERAKPAVSFGGRYRLVDIPISNCINSGFEKIFILTQFNSASLHNHITGTYIFDTFSKGFVSNLAAEQTFEHTDWYVGTADAVRKNFSHFRQLYPSHYLILSGDQLYRMDLRKLFKEHQETDADITVATIPVTREKASALGIMKIDESGRIREFVEKPGLTKDTSEIKIPDIFAQRHRITEHGRKCLASMGIYLFNASVLDEALDNNLADFGRDIIPTCCQKFKLHSYIFTGFWEDIGTIKSFYQTNINLTQITPDFNFYDEKSPIYTQRQDLPSTKVNQCYIYRSITAEGSIITNATLLNSIIGIRNIIENNAYLDGVICMGANYYESPEEKEENRRKGIPDIGIGRNSTIKRAIIDKNARIGGDCRIGIDEIPRPDGDYETHSIRDGIIVIAKNSIIPDGTTI